MKLKYNDPETQSKDLTSENIDQLKKLFPNIVEEGKVNFDVLRQLLGDEVVSEQEYYRFTWPGKHLARQEALKSSTGTLRPAPKESVDWDKTQNLYIEGDNLEVLKLLQKSYFNKVKMIYIDPPYNTGKDILYKNDYTDNLNNYLRLNDRLDTEGNSLFTNSDVDGRYHSNWLNIMYPVITLSRNLLMKDGFIAIAIDHYEVHNLIKITDEIFGEENKVGIVSVVHKPEGRNQSKFFGESNEFMLVYAKSIKDVNFRKVIIDTEKLKEYNEIDIKGAFKRKNFIRKSDGKYSLRENKPDFYYPIYVGYDLTKLSIYEFENSIKVYPITESGQERTWKTTKETAQNRIENGELFCEKVNGRYDVYEKLREDQVIKTHWIKKEYHAYHFGTKILDNLLKSKTFDFPKSLYLIKDVVKLIVEPDNKDIILDFFSGSSTTAHAVMELNKEDILEGKEGNRKYIMVQLPEPTEEKSEAYKAGYKTIAEIGKERIRRAANQIKEELKDKPEVAEQLDLGFKVFKLDSSNMHTWDTAPEALEDNLFMEEVIKSDRTAEDVLYEVLLKYGLDLTYPIEEVSIDGKKVYSVGVGQLIFCLDDGVTRDTAQAIINWAEKEEIIDTKVVFKDSGFTNDVEKTNIIQLFKTHGIMDVKSI